MIYVLQVFPYEMVKGCKVRFALCVFMIFVVCILSRNAYSGQQPNITLNKTADMFFGVISFDTTHSGTIQLGTNGSVSIIGGVGIAHDGGGNSGTVGVTGSVADVIEIKCDTTGKLRNSNNTLNMQNVEVAIDTGVVFGSGNSCQGIKNNDAAAITVDLAVNPTPTILIGGELSVTSNSLVSGTYDSQNGGGKAITVRVIYQ